MYKISIIIPIYNAEKTINRAVMSVMKQTIGFENIELILIDDYSTDKSREIISNYSEEYDNIISIYSNINHGYPGYGRNMGIKKASSEYIMFMDNDDEYELDLCEKLYMNMINENADIIGCNYTIIDSNTKYIRKCGVQYNSRLPITNIYNQDILFYKDILVWNKLFKRDIILKNNILFKMDGYGEDFLFCIEYFIHSKKLTHLNNFYGYNHYDHGTNLSSVTFKYNMEVLLSYYEVLTLFKRYSINLDFNRMFYNNIQSSIERAILMERDYRNIKLFLEAILEFEKKINFENKYVINPIIKMINFLILKKHIFTSSLLIYMASTISTNRILKKIYRSLFIK